MCSNLAHKLNPNIIPQAYRNEEKPMNELSKVLQ